LVSNCEFRLVLSNLIVLSVCSHSFPYGEHLCRVLAWLNCPPYVFGLTCRILLKSSVTNRHLGHRPVISLESCDPSITTFDKTNFISYLYVKDLLSHEDSTSVEWIIHMKKESTHTMSVEVLLMLHYCFPLSSVSSVPECTHTYASSEKESTCIPYVISCA
jgi:hypothetical protein